MDFLQRTGARFIAKEEDKVEAGSVPYFDASWPRRVRRSLFGEAQGDEPSRRFEEVEEEDLVEDG